MKYAVNPLKTYGRYFSLIFTLIWISNLASTDAYFSIYALIAFLSFYFQISGFKGSGAADMKKSSLAAVLSVVFSGIVLLANYPLYTQLGDPARIGRSTSILMNGINGVFSFAGGICVARPIFEFVFGGFPASCNLRKHQMKYLPCLIFSSIFLFHLIHLLAVEYPGNFTEDTFTQISEMISGQYSNFNTFWHTAFFQMLYSFGYQLFSDVNAALCFGAFCQMVILIFAFTHCLMTMVCYGVPRWAVILSYLLFAIVPYNLALSISVWKDVLFAAGCLLLISAWVRIQNGIGEKKWWNFLVFGFGSILFIVARTNGWLIYLVTFLISLLFRKQKRKLGVLMAALSVLGWFMLNPALSMLQVEEGDLAESLSVPLQQVARVVADGCQLTEEEYAMIDRVADIAEVPGLYQNWISDPIKIEVRSKDYSYFQENFDDYVRLWVRLGLKYPWEYLKAWVDQTKGYWNAGYGYAMYSETVTDNPYGVEKRGGSNPIAFLFRIYFGLSRHLIFFEPLHSIGLHVWIFLLCLILNIWRRRKIWIISTPLLLLLVGMWFGTPVYCCFRYVYPLVASMPLIVSTTVWQPQGEC